MDDRKDSQSTTFRALTMSAGVEREIRQWSADSRYSQRDTSVQAGMAVAALLTEIDALRAQVSWWRDTGATLERREPTQAEGDANELRHDQSMGPSYALGECFVSMGNHHGHRCTCGAWVFDGPTICQRCTDKQAVECAVAENDRLRAALASERELGNRVVRECAGERAGYLCMHAELHEHLALMVSALERETSAGDGIAEDDHDAYVAAKSLLVRTAPGPSVENALIEMHDTREQASMAPGLTAALDEAVYERDNALNALDVCSVVHAHNATLKARLDAVGKVLEANGCDCDCDHDSESHDDDCERCLACRIGEAVGK